MFVQSLNCTVAIKIYKYCKWNIDILESFYIQQSGIKYYNATLQSDCK